MPKVPPQLLQQANPTPTPAPELLVELAQPHRCWVALSVHVCSGDQPVAHRSPSASSAQATKGKKAPTPAPYEAPKKEDKKTPAGPIWEKKPKNFSVGQDIQPRRDLSRYVKWPKYVRLQRQRKVLYQRLKVPPAINQFNNTLDKNLSINLFKLLHKYRPEDKEAKKERLAAAAEKKEAGEEAASKKPIYVKYGINHITKLCEQAKAYLVVIAHDVDPIEVRHRRRVRTRQPPPRRRVPARAHP